MDYQEAIDRITDHKEIHFQKEYPSARKIQIESQFNREYINTEGEM